MIKISYRLNHYRFKRNFLILYTLSMITTSCVTLACISLYSTSIWTYMYTLVLAISTTLVLCLQFYFLLSLRMRYRVLNVALRRSLGGIPKAIPHLTHSTSDEVIELINMIAIQHANLTRGVSIVNKCYSFQVRSTKASLYILLYVYTMKYESSGNFGELFSHLQRYYCMHCADSQTLFKPCLEYIKS